MANFLVALKLDRLRANLSAADGVEYTEQEVRKWLQDAGFEPRVDKWVVSESDIGHVDPSEVDEIELLPAD